MQHPRLEKSASSTSTGSMIQSLQNEQEKIRSQMVKSLDLPPQSSAYVTSQSDCQSDSLLTSLPDDETLSVESQGTLSVSKNPRRIQSIFFRFFEEQLEPIIPPNKKLASHRPTQLANEEDITQKSIRVAWNKKKPAATAYRNAGWIFPKTPHVVTSDDMVGLKTSLSPPPIEQTSPAQTGYQAKFSPKKPQNGHQTSSRSLTANPPKQVNSSDNSPFENGSTGYSDIANRKNTSNSEYASVRKKPTENGSTGYADLSKRPAANSEYSFLSKKSIEAIPTAYSGISNRNSNLHSNSESIGYSNNGTKPLQPTAYLRTRRNSAYVNAPESESDFQSQQGASSLTSYHTIPDPQTIQKSKLIGRYGVPTTSPSTSDNATSSTGYRNWNEEFQRTLKEVNAGNL